MPELLHNISLEAYKGETIALIGEKWLRENNIGENPVWFDSLPPRCVLH